MDDEFLDYFERELGFVREMGREFARKYPKVAGRLLMEPDKCEDPHTERLIESFAFICARVHKRLDDDLPEITQSLLNVLYPHYTSPIPSMSVVQFAPLLKNIPESGYLIGKGTPVFSKPVDGERCRFTTAYPVTLRPMEVLLASLGEPPRLVRNAQQAIRIRLKLHNKGTFSRLIGDSLRFYLNGPRQHIFHLYELLLNNVCHVECAPVGASAPACVPLAGDSIRPVGFDDESLLLPFPRESFPGYRLLQEYFAFPEKFLFLDIVGLSSLEKSDLRDTLDLLIYLDKPAKSSLLISSDTFRLHATPVVNVFSKTAEPIRIEHRKSEYRVIPDLRRVDSTEILAITEVTATLDASPLRIKEYQPLYCVSHHDDGQLASQGGACWHLQRRPSGRFGDRGTDVFISFCDLNHAPVHPPEETVTVRTVCSNRDLPARLHLGDPAGDFDTETAAPVEAILCLVKPTAVLRPALRGALQWRLISHLSLNHLSLVEGGEAPLKEILTLYDFDSSPATRQQIGGIVSVSSRHVARRVGQGLVQGVEVTIVFDEDRFVGSGLYLFASVLERFLGQYVSLNSFVSLVATTVQAKETVKKWPPRNGDRVLL